MFLFLRNAFPNGGESPTFRDHAYKGKGKEILRGGSQESFQEATTRNCTNAYANEGARSPSPK